MKKSTWKSAALSLAALIIAGGCAASPTVPTAAPTIAVPTAVPTPVSTPTPVVYLPPASRYLPEASRLGPDYAAEDSLLSENLASQAPLPVPRPRPWPPPASAITAAPPGPPIRRTGCITA